MATPIGQLEIQANEHGIKAIVFTDELTAELAAVKATTLAPVRSGNLTAQASSQTLAIQAQKALYPTEQAQQHLQQALKQLKEYFAGQRTCFSLPLAATGTAFQQQVWQALLHIPYGQSCSYGAIADFIQNPKAVRAVGAANGRNPLAIVVPCHRVIGNNGSLTGYAGGLGRKVWLLQHERQMATTSA
ncbi:methylated-DNA--[protein]-cysteine S-methyltransferase [Rheinheimera sp. 4Y26]|nr:methylated-DNA--[protein]-cysteine S-methyltransferase [Rheinheimera sp. 4Y26]